MHYSAYSFSRNGKPTINPRDSRVSLRSLGQREKLASKDYQHLDALYCNDGELDVHTVLTLQYIPAKEAPGAKKSIYEWVVDMQIIYESSQQKLTDLQTRVLL